MLQCLTSGSHRRRDGGLMNREGRIGREGCEGTINRCEEDSNQHNSKPNALSPMFLTFVSQVSLHPRAAQRRLWSPKCTPQWCQNAPSSRPRGTPGAQNEPKMLQTYLFWALLVAKVLVCCRPLDPGPAECQNL